MRRIVMFNWVSYEQSRLFAKQDAVTPVVLGKGKQLFSDVQKRTLQLKESRQFESGNVLLRYV